MPISNPSYFTGFSGDNLKNILIKGFSANKGVVSNRAKLLKGGGALLSTRSEKIPYSLDLIRLLVLGRFRS